MIRPLHVVVVISALFFSCSAASPQYARLADDKKHIDALLNACDQHPAKFKEALSRSFVAVSRKHMLTVFLYKMSFHPNAKALWKAFNTYYASYKTAIFERTFNNALANHLAPERRDRFVREDGILLFHVKNELPIEFQPYLAIGDTLMHSLARAGLVKIMEMILVHANKTDLREATDSCGRTILFSLHHSLIGWAVAAGWDVDARDLVGNTPMVYFLKTVKDAEARYKYVDALIQAGASVAAANDLGNSPVTLVSRDAALSPAWFRDKHAGLVYHSDLP